MDSNPDTRAEAPQEDPTRISEEDARTFVEQLRSAPAEQIIADVFSTLLTAAQVKLGRRDARLFIDLCTAMFEYAGHHVSDELRQQVENVLGQLRLGQVSAENHMAEKGESEPNDLRRTPTPPAAGARTGVPTGGTSTQSPSSKLWVPGR